MSTPDAFEQVADESHTVYQRHHGRPYSGSVSAGDAKSATEFLLRRLVEKMRRLGYDCISSSPPAPEYDPEDFFNVRV